MSMLEFAKSELTRAGLFDKDSDYGGMLGRSVMELIETFSKAGHSGQSAAMARSLFDKLANYEPLTPLTGEDDEWTNVTEIMGKICFQNKRCPRVFKRKDGTAYILNQIIFTDANGQHYTNQNSKVTITFPYTPTEKTYVSYQKPLEE